MRDCAYHESHVNYICENPVRRKLAETPKEYPWTSASGNYALDEPPQGLKPLEKESTLNGTAKAVP